MAGWLGWWTRGLLDRFVGGPGLRRGRLHPNKLSVGDPLDWWRIEELDRGRLLRLRAEMRLPGQAWLELVVGTDDAGRTLFRQRALFHPRGLPGELYWAAIRPFHDVVFGGMQRNIAHAAEQSGVVGVRRRELRASVGLEVGVLAGLVAACAWLGAWASSRLILSVLPVGQPQEFEPAPVATTSLAAGLLPALVAAGVLALAALALLLPLSVRTRPAALRSGGG